MPVPVELAHQQERTESVFSLVRAGHAGGVLVVAGCPGRPEPVCRTRNNRHGAFPGCGHGEVGMAVAMQVSRGQSSAEAVV